MVVNKLKNRIIETLSPLINHDYVLWDLPYHPNIGDLLIWEGEIGFLKEIPYRCLDHGSLETCSFPKLSSDVVILLHGGGNFGDIWLKHQEFRLKVISQYPDNRIIILPQTIHYSDNDMFLRDLELMRNHKDLHICARDSHSYDIINVGNLNVIQVPDMAFCIDLDVLKKHILTPEEKALFVKRNDVELNTRKEYRIKTSLSIEEKDWPTFDGVPVLNFMRLIFNKLAVSTGMPLFKNIYNAYMNLYRRISIKIGVRMVSSYKEVYTTRLHVAILRTLLDMSFCIYDNNYGKNKNFYNSWLHEYTKADLID